MFKLIEIILLALGLFSMSVGGGGGGLAQTQRDTQRMDDIARFLTAANDYQTNNSGKTPWYKGSTDLNFVRRYIDGTCSTSDGKKYSCTGNQFRDPDGTVYSFKYVGSLSSLESGGTSYLELNKMDHTIYVYTYASCGYSDGEIKRGTRERQYAILYRLENGSTVCNDNH